MKTTVVAQQNMFANEDVANQPHQASATTMRKDSPGPLLQLWSLWCGLCCIGVATIAFGTSLGSLLPRDHPPSSSDLLPAAVIAHCVNIVALKCMRHGFGVTFHTKYCRQLTAAIAFSVVFVYVSVPAALVLASLELTICPARCLWFPKKRPAAAQHGVVASGAATKQSRKSSAASEDIIGRPVLYRYAVEWGTYWKIRGAGRSFKDAEKKLSSEDFAALCTLDRDACRQLLVGFEESELRGRLCHSPYHRNEMSAVESWLREAAEAFDVALYTPRVKGKRKYKSKDVLVEEVILAVVSARTSQSASANSSPYSPDSWGKKTHARIDKWDLIKCYNLLVTLSPNDIRTRLNENPWRHRPQINNCLKEAAAAFGVPISQSKAANCKSNYRKKNNVIKDVLDTIHFTKVLVPGTAAFRDEKKRIGRKREMVNQNSVNHARNQLPLLQKITEMSFEESRDAVLNRECPEKLRLEVVKEFVEREKRLPRTGKGAVFEEIAASYVKSALERRHKSEGSGTQLHPNEVEAWDVIFQGYGVEWLEDQTFIDAKDFYRRTFNLKPKMYNWILQKRGSLSEEEERTKFEDNLARNLIRVRRAKVGDVWDYVNKKNKELFLFRRKLSPEAIMRWENEFGDKWEWFCGREVEAYIAKECIAENPFEALQHSHCRTLQAVKNKRIPPHRSGDSLSV